MSDTPTTEAPKELSEIVHFVAGLVRTINAAYRDDKKISVIEAFGLIGSLHAAVPAFSGIQDIPAELSRLTPAQTTALADVVAHHFADLLPHQHQAVLAAVLACLPPITNLVQMVRNEAALAADFPSQFPAHTPRATLA